MHNYNNKLDNTPGLVGLLPAEEWNIVASEIINAVSLWSAIDPSNNNQLATTIRKSVYGRLLNAQESTTNTIVLLTKTTQVNELTDGFSYTFKAPLSFPIAGLTLRLDNNLKKNIRNANGTILKSDFFVKGEYYTIIYDEEEDYFIACKDSALPVDHDEFLQQFKDNDYIPIISSPTKFTGLTVSADGTMNMLVAQVLDGSDNKPPRMSVLPNGTIKFNDNSIIDKTGPTKSSKLEFYDTNLLYNGRSVWDDIIDNLISTRTDAVLSANQGRVIKGMIDDILDTLETNDINLDELQEIVNYIKLNRLKFEEIGWWYSATETSDGNVVTITPKDFSHTFTTIKDGLVIGWKSAKTNTGRAYLKVNNVNYEMQYNGINLEAGYIRDTHEYKAVYSSVKNKFDIISLTGGWKDAQMKSSGGETYYDVPNVGQMRFEVGSAINAIAIHSETKPSLVEIATDNELANGIDNKVPDAKTVKDYIDIRVVPATEIASGIAEIATQTEANGSVDDTRIITPKKLYNRTATETRRGIAEVATQTEANGSVDDTRIITPKKLYNRTATEARRGVAEVATQTEANANTDDTRIITPMKLNGRTATETRRGVAEIATQTEANGSTDDTRIITPLKLFNRTATTTRRGVVELSTTTEMSDGSTTTIPTAFTVKDYVDKAIEANKPVQATETVKGIAEVATQIEANGSTDDLRFITPMKLSQRTATETRRGIVELATATEMNDGNTTRIPTAFTVKTYVDDEIEANKPVQATETVMGIAEVATQTEANGSTDDLRFITAKKLYNRTATETRRGIAEVATQTEANGSTDDSRFITPKKLYNRTATEYRRGVVELATQTETNAGTDDSRSITPKKLASYYNTKQHYFGSRTSLITSRPDGSALREGDQIWYKNARRMLFWDDTNNAWVGDGQVGKGNTNVRIISASSSNPSSRDGGSGLRTGDAYYNTSANEWRCYDGSTWV